MNQHIEFMRHLRANEALDPDYKLVTRSYQSVLHETELLIHMPQSTWDYADWLEAEGKALMPLWLMDCETNLANDMPISKRLMTRLWNDECSRHYHGLPTPTDTPPQGFATWRQPVNDR